MQKSCALWRPLVLVRKFSRALYLAVFVTGMTANERCAIFKRIDELDSARSVREMARLLKPILNEMAYAHVTGDSSASSYREEWHSQYTDALREESDVSAPKDAIKPTAARPSRSRQSVPQSLQSILDGTHPSLRD